MFETLIGATQNKSYICNLNIKNKSAQLRQSVGLFLCPYINGCMWLNHQKNNRYNRTVYRKISLWSANQRVPKTARFKSKLNQKANPIVIFNLIGELIRIGRVGKCLLRAYTSIIGILKMWKYPTGVVGYNSIAAQIES